VSDQVMKRSNWLWIYKMGRFGEERRPYICDPNKQGHSMQTLRNVNSLMLEIAERANALAFRQQLTLVATQIGGLWPILQCYPCRRRIWFLGPFNRQEACLNKVNDLTAIRSVVDTPC
jgi:hypothetical protein